jgi:hypothetical protein
MRRACTGIVCAAAILTSAVFVAKTKELNIVLKWNPNEKVSIPVLDTTGGLYPLTLAPIVDKRDKGTQVGENTEDKIPVPVYTNSDIPAFVAQYLADRLTNAGLEVKPGEGGDRVLRSELQEFWVAERDRYRGTVRLRVGLTDSAGKELWSAVVVGTSDRFGRSLKPDNYTESVSNAIQDMAAKLISASGFRPALGKT